MLFTAITLSSPCGYGYGYGVCFSMIPHNKRRAGPIIMAAAAGEVISLKSLPPIRTVPPKIATLAVAAAVIFVVVSAAAEAGPDTDTWKMASGSETLSNVPQTLSGECLSGDCKKARIQKPKSRKAETCTVKCVNTCIRGGSGSPGEGPLNIRRPLVVFKEGFRSRQYCLVECSDICNLIGDGDDGP